MPVEPRWGRASNACLHKPGGLPYLPPNSHSSPSTISPIPEGAGSQYPLWISEYVSRGFGFLGCAYSGYLIAGRCICRLSHRSVLLGPLIGLRNPCDCESRQPRPREYARGIYSRGLRSERNAHDSLVKLFDRCWFCPFRCLQV